MIKIIEDFERYCMNHPGKRVFILDETILTYGELMLQIEQWYAQLLDSRIQKGAKILLAVDDKLKFIVLWLSIWKAGGVPIPIDADIKKEELLRALKSAQPEYMILNKSHHSGYIAGLGNNGEVKEAEDLKIIRLHEEERLTDIAFLVYTSGTTGKPKCVVYDNNAVEATIDSLIDAYQLTEHDVAITPMSPALPATLFSIILPILLSGGTLILEKDPIPGKLLKKIQRDEVTIFFAVPYFYRLLLEAACIRGYAGNKNLRLCLSTSAYLPTDIFEKFYKLTGQMIRSIFCTSEIMYITYHYEEDFHKIMYSVGRPQKGIKIKIIKDEESTDTDEGEILVSGTHASEGYYNNQELWEEVYKDGWIHTGDKGFMDREGYLYITGRINNTINVGGYLVSPEELEEVLESHTKVREALVLGEADELTGERVTAYIVAKKEVKKEDILSYCKQRLHDYKIPSRIVFLSEIPKGRYGKKKRSI